ncbi:unnamed protein product [Spirodela intermedia]|uniref:Peptide N-acetyl-beta-D-glucosaminyl asparaginase amidase A N-terminal domain-containing protein n=1 Tax=Spirodela intermedia TaxID=51605 RepID=A0A7I8K617_SPIIN|nr:unnamed protein product [Spirodela intermedia]
MKTTMRFSQVLPLVFFLLCIGGSFFYRAAASEGYRLRRVSLPDPEGEEEDEGVECVDPTPPQASPAGSQSPSCSALLLQYEFGHTVGFPPVAVNYTPPENCRWNRAVLEFSASCAGEQSDRIAAVWLDGVEILRTSTARPSQAPLFWKVRKDVTHFSSLLVPLTEQRGRRKPGASPRVLYVMLENSINNVYKGVYSVNVSIDFYGRAVNVPGRRNMKELNLVPEALEANGKLTSILASVTDEEDSEEDGFVPVEPHYGGDGEGSSELPVADSYPAFVTEQKKLKNLLGRPADMVIPVSNTKIGDQSGFWFRIDKESDIRGIRRRIPRNAYKAVLEVCVSFHGDDEFWYTNPPDSYNLENNLPSRRGNWAFRELVVTVDGLYVGSVLPFPVVFPGGINPLMWTPVVAIRAFDLPTYDLDLTPFLGNLLNGRPHAFNFQVDYALPFWLVNANLHLWLDARQRTVPALLVKHHGPPTFLSRNANNKFLEGHFQLEAARQARFEGWARSSLGNFTTLIDTHFKYKSSVEYKLQGVLKDAYSQTKYTADVRITERPNRFLARVINEAKYPVRMISSTDGIGDRMLAKTNLSHILYEFTDITLNQMRSQIAITDMQIAGGVLQAVDDVLAGAASTLQTYQRRDNGRCHTRKVTALNGGITGDQTTTDCNMVRAPTPLLAI